MTGPREEAIKVRLSRGTVCIWRGAACELDVFATSGGPMQGEPNLSRVFELATDAIGRGDLDLSEYVC
ncbi:MAG: hypothetical protein ABIK79_06575 [Chloroflexota bacterium]|nr:hypothetical protein [Anaerolineae bacterium]